MPVAEEETEVVDDETPAMSISSSQAFSNVGQNDTAVGLRPAVYHRKEDNDKTIGGVEKDGDSAALAKKRNVFSCLIEEEKEAKDVASEADEPSESSSIGVASSSEDEEDEEEEVESKRKEGAFGSLVSLDDSLPIKRGLSNFFSGKSKSFANLSDVGNACDLVKPENSFNKRRRILMGFKARSASYGSLVSASTNSSSSLSTLLSPVHVVAEGSDGEEEEEEDGMVDGVGDRPNPALVSVAGDGRSSGEMKPMSSFRSLRSFSLSDLRRGQ